MGCAFVGLPYGEQLIRKRAAVRAAFAAHPRLGALEIPEVVGSPRAFGYRTQAKLVLRRARRGVLVGVYRPGTHQVIDISRCPVHHPLIARVIEAAREAIDERDLSVYDERLRQGALRYLAVRVSAWQKQAQLIVVTAEPTLPAGRSLVRDLQRRVRGLVSVVQNVNADPGNVVFGPVFQPLTPAAWLMERVGALRLRCQAGSFFQANVPMARRIYELAAAWAAPQPGGIAVDLYCGVGGLAFHLTPHFRRVIGIEESPPAVLDARFNVRLNGVSNARFVQGTAAGKLDEVREVARDLEVVTVNPPRKGVEEPAREAIARAQPARIVYVSCDLRTLARDLAWFSERGYSADRVQAFDMLPQTDHVETVALLSRG